VLLPGRVSSFEEEVNGQYLRVVIFLQTAPTIDDLAQFGDLIEIDETHSLVKTDSKIVLIPFLVVEDILQDAHFATETIR
jgi:hypothetical protein